MGGWVVVLAAAVGVATGARWYVKGGGVAGYRGGDEDRIRRVRAQVLYGGYGAHE